RRVDGWVRRRGRDRRTWCRGRALDAAQNRFARVFLANDAQRQRNDDEQRAEDSRRFRQHRRALTGAERRRAAATAAEGAGQVTATLLHQDDEEQQQANHYVDDDEGGPQHKSSILAHPLPHLSARPASPTSLYLLGRPVALDDLQETLRI